MGESTAVTELNAYANLQVYPNPVQDELNVKADVNIKRIILLNSLGQYITDVHPANSSHLINTSNLPRGMYIINVTLSDGHTLTRKIIKE